MQQFKVSLPVSRAARAVKKAVAFSSPDDYLVDEAGWSSPEGHSFITLLFRREHFFSQAATTLSVTVTDIAGCTEVRVLAAGRHQASTGNEKQYRKYEETAVQGLWEYRMKE